MKYSVKAFRGDTTFYSLIGSGSQVNVGIVIYKTLGGLLPSVYEDQER